MGAIRGLTGDEGYLIISCYPWALTVAYGGREERDLKLVVTPTSLYELGIKQQGDVVEQFGEARGALLNSEILRRGAPYVVLVRDGNLEGIIDRMDLASRMASAALQ